jgi:CRISPR-associated protein Csm3
MKWEKVVRLTFQIHCVEGLRIGGSGGGLEIGELIDANLAAIREPATNEFYLPGSSLKGKLRSVLEKKLGKENEKVRGEPCGCGRMDCLVCKVFGAHKNSSSACAPTRVVVRDAFLSEASRQWLKTRQSQGEPVAEIKTENTVNRKTGAAEHPRTGERALPGTVFDGEILLHVYSGDNEQEMSKFVRQGLGIIQDGSSVGASGSRGHGKVRFENVKEEVLELDQLTV